MDKSHLCCYVEKKPDSKGYILYDSIYVMLWKKGERKKDKNINQTSDCQWPGKGKG